MKPEIYAWIADGDENGIVAVMTPIGSMPAVAMDRRNALKFEPMVSGIARTAGVKVRLLKFSNPEEIAVVDGRAKE